MADAKYVDGVPLPKLTQAYLNLKAARDELSAEYKKADEKLVNKQNKIKSALLSYLKENDIKSVKTDAGTFYRTVKQKYWTSDWGSMHEFILEHGLPDLLEKRLHQTNVRTFLEENEDLLPKGLNVDSEYSLSVRRPKK